jgi:phosphoglucosamine mutase
LTGARTSTGALPARLFGTDGVRGVAGGLLSAELALALGRAAATLVAESSSDRGASQALVIRDTRESGPALEAALAAGVSAAGSDVLLAGVLPTPAAPLLVRRYGLDLGIVVSASHNAYHDNGIKLFGRDGFKLGDALEQQVEARVREELAGGRDPAGRREPPAPPARFGSVSELRGAAEDYLRELHIRFRELDLSGLDVVLDCANGATYRAAPEIFRRLGARVTVLADRPDGRNINDGCGSTSIDGLVAAMREGDHEVGFAFDGDGDRVLAVDRAGAVVDGDEMLALAALHMKAAGRLSGDGVAVTVMTNYGFHAAMQQAGIEVATTDVGDRFVLEELRAREWVLGGEQSGHIIELGFNRSGDGVATALLVLEALRGRSLSERDAMHRFPQHLVNVRVRDRDALPRAHAVHEAVGREHASLAGRGRVLLRASGTEPVVRVMAEAPTAEEAQAVCARLASLVQRELG